MGCPCNFSLRSCLNNSPERASSVNGPKLTLDLAATAIPLPLPPLLSPCCPVSSVTSAPSRGAWRGTLCSFLGRPFERLCQTFPLGEQRAIRKLALTRNKTAILPYSNGGDECGRRNRSDAGNRHQPSAGFVLL